MATPSAIVVKGSTSVSVTCTLPVAATVKGKDTLAVCAMLPVKVSVTAAGAVAVVVGAVVAEWQAVAAKTTRNEIAARIADLLAVKI
jgi:hypothetical protein